MCGFLFHFGPKVKLSESNYHSSLKHLRSRGPDFQSIVMADDSVMVHTRLAIIDDANEDANQPFWDETKRWALLYNGEIYNYRDLRAQFEQEGAQFRTNSDTEVLLYSLLNKGLDATLKLVRGMFAFVLYDREQKEFTAVRDHFGQKPLYVYEGADEVIFASNIPAILELLQDTPKINLESVQTYLTTNGITDPAQSCFKDIRMLPAGNYIQWANSSLKEKEYFFVADMVDEELHKELSGESEAALIERLDFLFAQSVRRHLESDVPLGVLLSGGIDSTLVFAYAHEQAKDLTAFTKLSPGIESIPMSVVPRLLMDRECKWVKTNESPRKYLREMLSFIQYSGNPSRWGGGPPMFRLCQSARGEGVKALLGGDCADEFFGGYLTYNRRFEEFHSANARDRHRLLGELVGINRNSPFFQEGWGRAYEEGQLKTRSRISERLADLGLDEENQFVESSLLHDTHTFLQACNLPHSDAYSMKASIELRNPMLDFDLVRFVINLPTAYKFARSKSPESPNKWLLRQLARKKVGDFVDVRKEGTRNYSVAISDEKYWKIRDFSINSLLTMPETLTEKERFKWLNVELFYRSFWGTIDPDCKAVLTDEGKRALLG